MDTGVQSNPIQSPLQGELDRVAIRHDLAGALPVATSLRLALPHTTQSTAFSRPGEFPPANHDPRPSNLNCCLPSTPGPQVFPAKRRCFPFSTDYLRFSYPRRHMLVGAETAEQRTFERSTSETPFSFSVSPEQAFTDVDWRAFGHELVGRAFTPPDVQVHTMRDTHCRVVSRT